MDEPERAVNLMLPLRWRICEVLTAYMIHDMHLPDGSCRRR